MKVRLERQPLADALGWVTRVITKAPSVAVLAGVRITASEDGITIRAFDFETSHSATLLAEVGGEGECLVPGYFLRDAVSGGRGKDVELVLDSGTLTVSSGRSTYRLRTLALEDYPALPEFPAEVGTIPGRDLAEAVAAVLPAVDDASPNEKVRGLRIEGADHLTLVGTDARRFHAVELAWDGREFATTVPGKSLSQALRGLAGDVTLGCSGNLLGLADGSRQVTTRIYDTPFIDWRVVPAGTESKLVGHVRVDGEELLAAVKQVGSMMPDGHVALDFDGSDLAVTTGAQSDGEGTELLAAEGEKPFRAAFAPRYLTDTLAVTTGGPVELHHVADSEKSAPLLVRDPAWPGQTLIVMSLRTGGNR